MVLVEQCGKEVGNDKEEEVVVDKLQETVIKEEGVTSNCSP